MAMRQILIDHARTKTRAKRGGVRQREELDERMLAIEANAEALLDVDRALEALAKVDPRLVRVVECRYFGGLSETETAAALGVSTRTAQRDWLKARAWLRHSLGPRAED